MRSSLANLRPLGLSSSLALVSVAILIQACSSPAADPAPATGGSVGATTGGSAATTGGTTTGGTTTGGTTTTTGGISSGGTTTGGTTTGGTTTGGTVSTTTGGQPSGGSSGASASGGSAGAAGGNAGTGGGGSSAGGVGGTAGSSGGGAGGAAATGGSGGKGGAGGTAGGGGSGGTGAGKTAIAMLAPTSGNQLTGTGTFTQTGQAVTLVIQVSNCPTGSHASHIHVNKNCGSNGDDAGGHWVPQGEVLPDIVCAADGTGTATVTPPNGTWTIGAGSGDVTAHALMVHTGNMASPGGRIACGLINAQ